MILCGGTGTRPWPISRATHPQQYWALAGEGEGTLLQQTLQRLDGIAGLQPPLLICNENHRFNCFADAKGYVAEPMRQIGVDPEGILLEPMGRNTAPAVAVAALQATARGDDPLLLVLAADHVIRDAADLDFLHLEREAFAGCPSVAIDMAVMEHTDRGAVLALEADWSDVGSWSALWETADQDGQGNVLRSRVIHEDARNCYLRSEHRLVVGLGVEDLVVVETDDVVLVAHRDRAQDVKAIVGLLEREAAPESKAHRKIYRPWGSHDGVTEGERWQVKRILSNPGASLSLQMHHHRAEHWIVVQGTALVGKDCRQELVGENQSTYIPLGGSHRLSNRGKIPVELIEGQSGPYLGEDDIVRFEDRYGRIAA